MAKTLYVTTIILFVFAMSIFWLSNAEKVVLNSDNHGVSKAPHNKRGLINMPEGELKTRETITTTIERDNITHLSGVCSLCQDVTKGMLSLLRSKKMQTGIMAIVRGTCYLLFKINPTCMTIINSYGLTFFTMVKIAQPRMTCHSIHLCSPNPANSTTILLSEDTWDTCEVCRYVVGKTLSQLTYPNKQLEITMESTVVKTLINEKHMRSEFAVKILANIKRFLEAIDLCARTHAFGHSRCSSNK